MNAETKLALVFLGAIAGGLGLMGWSLWPHYRLAAGIGGLAIATISARLFAAVWRR